MADNNQLLDQIRKVVREENEPIKKDLQDVKQSLEHTNTALEAVAVGQKEIRETMATKADVQDLKAEIVKKIKKHDDRLDALEAHTGSPNPHKN